MCVFDFPTIRVVFRCFLFECFLWWLWLFSVLFLFVFLFLFFSFFKKKGGKSQTYHNDPGSACPHDEREMQRQQSGTACPSVRLSVCPPVRLSVCPPVRAVGLSVEMCLTESSHCVCGTNPYLTVGPRKLLSRRRTPRLSQLRKN